MNIFPTNMYLPPFRKKHTLFPYSLPGSPAYPPLCYEYISSEKGVSKRLMRPKDNPPQYFKAQLLTPELDKIHRHLWLAGLPKPARPLHRQILLRREFVVTEDPNEHLVWKETRIFLKPMPSFLLDYTIWKRHLCLDDELFRNACGMILSYSWLVNFESDLEIAKDYKLVPKELSWEKWVQIINDFLEFFDDDPTGFVAQRYRYGELRLSRINMIYRFAVSDISAYQRIYGFIRGSTWEREWFREHFAWLIAVFAYVTFVLSSMQLGLATQQLENDSRFHKASYGFAVALLLVVAITFGAIPLLWVSLLTFHIISTVRFHARVKSRRKNAARDSV